MGLQKSQEKDLRMDGKYPLPHSVFDSPTLLDEEGAKRRFPEKK